MSNSVLRYDPQAKLPWGVHILMALQLLASAIATIVAPALLISEGLMLTAEDTSFLVSVSLLCSGIATFIQVNKIGKIGSGLLVVEGVNIAFVSVVISAGVKMIENKLQAGADLAVTQTSTLGTIFTCLMLASAVSFIFALFLKYFRKHLSPVVLGTMITLIGLCLFKVGAFALGGGQGAVENGTFGEPKMWFVGLIVFILVLFFQSSRFRLFSMAAILWALVGGAIASAFWGLIPEISYANVAAVSIPTPFAYGIGFDLPLFINLSLLCILLVFVNSGIISDSCMASGIKPSSSNFNKHLQGGVLGASLNGTIAGAFCCLPTTPYAQINGIIGLSGIATRKCGYSVAALLLIASLFPVISHTFMLVPQPVWGAITLFLFGSIAISGFKFMLINPLENRDILIIASALSLGLAVEFYPELWAKCHPMLGQLFSSGIIFGSCIAVLLQLILPHEHKNSKK